MKTRFVILCLAGVAAALCSCTSTDERVVARVGGHEVTVAKIKNEYLAISEHARPQLASIEEKEAFAKDVVAKEVIRLEALKAGFGDLPEATEARQTALQNMAWQAFFEGEIRSKVSASEEEMRDLYDRQRVAYHLAWIFTRSKGMGQEALDKIESGRPFGEVAGIYSIDPSRGSGGDLGLRPPGNMPDDIESIIESMSPGDISGVLTYDGYYAIIKFIETQERAQIDFESAKVGLESVLMTKRITERQKTLAAGYREKYHVTYNEDVIEMIAARTRAANPREDGPPGRLPRFSEEELGLVVSSNDNSVWTVGKYMERISTVRDFGRPSYGADAEFVRSIMRDYMTGELWVLEALDLGYGEQDDVVLAADREYERLVITAFHDSLVKDVVVDDTILREFYDENREQLMSEPLYNLAIIAVETRTEADEIYEELQGGADFAALAKARSIDPRTRDQGGVIKETFTGRNLQQFPDVHDVVYVMEAGEIARPMLLPPAWGAEGFMVLKVLMKEEPRQLEFAEVKDALWERVLELEQDKVFSLWLAEKMDELDVSLNPDVLAAINFSAL